MSLQTFDNMVAEFRAVSYIHFFKFSGPSKERTGTRCWPKYVGSRNCLNMSLHLWKRWLKLRSTLSVIESLARQFVKFWKHDVLSFDTAKITKKFTVGEDDFRHPNFLGKIKTNVAKYYQNYHSGYTPAKMHDRINSL